MVSEILVPSAFALFGMGGLVALINRSSNRTLASVLFSGCTLLLLGAAQHWPAGFSTGSLPVYIGGLVPFQQTADAISLFFLIILCVASMAVALYSPCYLSHLKKDSSAGL